MKLQFKKKTSSKQIARIKNKVRIRKKVFGTAEKPRLTIYKSLKHIYGQLVDDATGQTLVSASSLDAKLSNAANKDAAKQIGQELAKRALAKNINQVVFDRNGWIYHGRVQSFAEGAREGGLKF